MTWGISNESLCIVEQFYFTGVKIRYLSFRILRLIYLLILFYSLFQKRFQDRGNINFNYWWKASFCWNIEVLQNWKLKEKKINDSITTYARCHKNDRGLFKFEKISLTDYLLYLVFQSGNVASKSWIIVFKAFVYTEGWL